MVLSYSLRSIVGVLAFVASLASLARNASAVPSNQSGPDKSKGNPNAQDEINNDKPTGTGEKTKGDPVEISTGAFVFSKKVLELPGRGQDLSLTLSYVSNAHGIETQTGARWTHDLEEKLVIHYSWGGPVEPYEGPADIGILLPTEEGMTEGEWVPRPLYIDVYHFHDLRVDYYSQRIALSPTSEDWIPTSGQFTKLTSEDIQVGPYRMPQSFRLRYPNGTIVDFPHSNWEGSCGIYTIRAGSITDRQGNQVVLDYEAISQTPTCGYGEGAFYNRLETAVDTLGREVDFEYDSTTGWLNLIRDHTGRTVEIVHDSDGNITDITTPSVNVFPPDTTVLPYASTTRFGYAAYNSTYPNTKHNIAWIAAPTEVALNQTSPQPYVVNTWDPTGERVMSQALGGTNGSLIPAGGVHAYLYESSTPPASQVWFDYAARTLTVSPDGHTELHYFDADWRPRLVYRFTGGLDPSAVAGGTYTIDDLVLVNPSYASTADALKVVSGVTLPSIGSDVNNVGCLWTETDYTSSNLPSVERTSDSRTEYYYDGSNPDRFQKGNLLALKRILNGGTRAIIHAYAYEPLYNQVRVEYDPRAFGSYSPPNGGSHTADRYAKTYSFDYQALSATSGPVDDLADDWGIDLTQSSATSFLGGAGYLLAVDPIAFAGGSTGSIAGNVVGEDRPVRVYLDPQANPPTFQTITESTTTTYNSFGLPTTVLDPGNFATTFTYYAANAVAPQPGTSASASNGGYLASMTRAVDLTTTVVTEHYGYDAVGRQTVHRNARGYDTTSVYDEMDRLVQVTDALGTDRGTLYDANGNAVEELAEYSTPAMSSSTGLPNSTSTYPRFIRTEMEYDLLDNLVTRSVQNSVSGAPSVSQYRYTKGGARVLSLFPEWSNDDKNVEATVFDEFGRLHTSTMGGVSAQFAALFANQSIPELGSIPVDVAGVTTTSKSFYAGSRKVTDRDAEGLDTDYEYDGFNRLIRTTTPLGHYTVFAYDQASQRTQSKSYQAGGSLLATTDTRYDERRQAFEILRVHTSAAGIALGADGLASTRYEYNARGLCVRIVDDANEATITAYDGLGRAERVDDAEGNSSLFTYDPNGNLIYSEVHEPETDVTSTVHVRKNWAFHDALDRVTTTVDHLGHAVRTRYDTLGRVVFTSDARTTTANINVALNSLDSSTHPQHSGLSTSFMVNSHGNTTWFTYDDAGYQLSTTRHMRVSGLGGNSLLSGGAGAIVTTRAYNLNGHLISETDDKGNVTGYGYDSLNRRNLITYADNTTWTCTYYLRGLVKTTQDPNGTIIEYDYDDDGRQTLETVTALGHSDVVGATSASFQYDGLGRMTRAQNSAADVLREYDTLSQLTAETLNGHRTEIYRAGNGFLQGYMYPSTRTLNHSRDGIGRLRAINEQGGSTAITELEYRGVHAIKSRQYFNGTSTSYVYDGILRPYDVTHAFGSTTLARRTSTWDRQSNRATREDPTQSPVRTFTYTYDSAARMVQSDRVGGGQSPETITYSLDDVGNRTSVSGGPDAGTYTQNTTDSPVNLYTSTPAGACAYDDNATLQTRGAGASELRYDYRDRLIEYEDIANSRLHVFAYDALGRRVTKTTDVGTSQEREVRYFYNGGWTVVEERDGNDDVIATLVYEDGLDALVEAQRDDSGGGSFAPMAYHSDDHLNVLAVSNGSGAVIEEYEYRDYGQIVNPSTMQPATASAIGNATAFAGREYDWETGLYNYRNRYLDPRSGRFISKDPIGVWGDSSNHGNGQTYCASNPWSSLDPLGLSAMLKRFNSLISGAMALAANQPRICGYPATNKGPTSRHNSGRLGKAKSGRRLSDGNCQVPRRSAAASGAAQNGSGSIAGINRLIDKTSDSTSDSAELGEVLDILSYTQYQAGDLPFESGESSSPFGGGSGASTGVQDTSTGSGFGWRDAASITADSIPGVSTAKTVIELWTGFDPFTGEPIPRWVSFISLGASFLPGGKTGVKTGARSLRLLDDGVDAAKGAPHFVVTPGGTAYPVPKGASGPVPVVNDAGKTTGTAFTGGNGGANGQVDTIRLMDPTAPKGANPGAPNGYIKYENATGQGVNPYTGKTGSRPDTHFPID